MNKIPSCGQVSAKPNFLSLNSYKFPIDCQFQVESWKVVVRMLPGTPRTRTALTPVASTTRLGLEA